MNPDSPEAKPCDRVRALQLPTVHGRVTSVGPEIIRAELIGLRPGARVIIKGSSGNEITAEVADCSGNKARLVPLNRSDELGIGDHVKSTLYERSIPVGPSTLGRILDPLGQPLDDLGPLVDARPWPISHPAPNPMTRPPIKSQLVTGLRSIDSMIPLGVGQRTCLSAGPGLGKTTLIGQLARRARVDAAVICLVGERGREVRHFIDEVLGEEGLARSIVIVSSADAPPMQRASALETATAYAEWLREETQDVLLVVDSLTRVVRALRDVAFALGETPTRNGYPASAFSRLPGWLERTGTSPKGSITAVYSVLTETEGDDPIAQEARALLDGHIILSPKLARAGRYPAIDVVTSVSRVAREIVPSKQSEAAVQLRRALDAYREQEDLVLMGAYAKGSDPDTDFVLQNRAAIAAFLAQKSEESSPINETQTRLLRLVEHLA